MYSAMAKRSIILPYIPRINNVKGDNCGPVIAQTSAGLRFNTPQLCTKELLYELSHARTSVPRQNNRLNKNELVKSGAPLVPSLHLVPSTSPPASTSV